SDARFETSENIGERLTISVVEMDGDTFQSDFARDHLHQSSRLQRRPDADRVAQRNFRASDGAQLSRDGRDLSWRDGPLIGATERAGDIATRPNALARRF